MEFDYKYCSCVLIKKLACSNLNDSTSLVKSNPAQRELSVCVMSDYKPHWIDARSLACWWSMRGNNTWFRKLWANCPPPHVFVKLAKTDSVCLSVCLSRTFLENIYGRRTVRKFWPKPNLLPIFCCLEFSNTASLCRETSIYYFIIYQSLNLQLLSYPMLQYNCILL